MACEDCSGGPLRAAQRACCLGRRPGWSTLEDWPKRCVLVFLLFLGFSLTSGMRRSFAEAALSLREEAHVRLFSNDTSLGDWSSSVIRSFQSSFTWGLFIGHVIGSALAYKYPANRIFAAAIALDSSLHLVVAGVMQVHQVFLVSLVFLQGVADGMTFPAFMGLLRFWAPPTERTRMFVMGYAGLHFGGLLSFQVFTVFKTLLSSTAGLYFYGTVGILWVLPWILLVSESPSKHPTISTREKIYIVESLHQNERAPFSHYSLPMRSILSSGPVLAVFLASFSRTWTFNALLHMMKWHYRDEVRYAKELPYLLMMVSVCISGVLADVLQVRGIMSTSTVRKTFGGTGMIAEGVFFLSLVCFGPTNVALVLYFLAMTVRETAVAGFMVNPLDIAPHYAGVIGGLACAVSSLGDLTFYPMMKQIFNTWRIRHDHMTPLYAVSVISGGLQFVGGLIFVVFSSATEQEWSKPDSPGGDGAYGSGGNNNNDVYVRNADVIGNDGICLNVIVKR